MIMYKKVLSYIKTTKPIVIARHTLILALFFCFFLVIFLYFSHEHNVEVVYENLNTVERGEDIKTAIKKMKRNTVCLTYSTQKCLDCDGDENIWEVMFYVRGSIEYYSNCPRILYNNKTNRVVWTSSGEKMYP